MQCNAYKANNVRCTRKTKHFSVQYCWQHKDIMAQKQETVEIKPELKGTAVIGDYDIETIVYSYLELDDILKLLKNNKPKLERVLKKFDFSNLNSRILIQKGHLEALKYFLQKFDKRLVASAMHTASRYGRVEMLKYFHTLGMKPDKETWNIALDCAQFQVMEYLETFGFKLSKNCFDQTSNFQTIQYLVSRGLVPYKKTMDRAFLDQRDINLIKYYHSLGIAPTANIYDSLMTDGDKNLVMIKLLIQMNIPISNISKYKMHKCPQIYRFLISCGYNVQ